VPHQPVVGRVIAGELLEVVGEGISIDEQLLVNGVTGI
jgi:hypothetical protein